MKIFQNDSHYKIKYLKINYIFLLFYHFLNRLTALNVPYNFKHIIYLFLVVFVGFNKLNFKRVPTYL